MAMFFAGLGWGALLVAGADLWWHLRYEKRR